MCSLRAGSGPALGPHSYILAQVRSRGCAHGLSQEAPRHSEMLAERLDLRRKIIEGRALAFGEAPCEVSGRSIRSGGSGFQTWLFLRWAAWSRQGQWWSLFVK